MFESYMFVPANKEKYIKKSSELKFLDYRIFDLEDSILKEDVDISIKNLKNTNILKTDWVRLPLQGFKQLDFLDVINEIGINNYVIPKFSGYEEFKTIFSNITTKNNKVRLILLIENSKAYLELDRILKEFSESIYGVSLGIHDFSFNTGVKNDYKFLNPIRLNISLLAKSYFVKSLDVVSVNLKDKEKFEKEIINGFELGYRAKLLIHPNQLEILNNIEFYSFKYVENCKKIITYYEENVEGKDNIFTYNNRVYENMHINNMKQILKWGENFYETDW